MNEMIERVNTQLPDTLEDLTQFVLVGKAKLNAYMLKLRTVNKLSTAQEIRDQTLREAQEVSTALIAAEQRIGELLLAIPTAQGKRTDRETSSTQVDEVKTKTETIREMGYTKDEASDYQQMAKNPEIIRAVINAAVANGEVVTKAQVMREIREAKAEAARDIQPKLVVPNDYEDLKEKASLYRTQARSAEQSRLEAIDRLRAAEQRIRDLEERKDISELQKKLEEEAGYFAIRTYDYIQKNGGFVWITERLEQLPDKQRKEFINTVYAINAFANQMVENIGGYGIE